MRNTGLAKGKGILARIRSFAAATGTVASFTLGVSGLAAIHSAVPALASQPSCISARNLGPGQFITSPAVQGNYYYKLVMQGDGNLVEYALRSDNRWHPLWDSQTSGQGNYLAVQGTDGNLVVYSRTGTPLWTARVGGAPNDRLCMQSDGNLVAYSTSNAPVWATMTSVTASFGATISSNPFPGGQCTWYADQKFAGWTGKFISWRGDAWQWAVNARAQGWKVGTTPRAGSIVVYQKYAAGAGGFGHVGYVLDVYPSQGKVLIAEMNYLGLGRTDTRLVTASDAGANRYTGQPNIQYIYVNPGA